MGENEEAVISKHDAGHGSLGSYATGFVLSILFTLAPYHIVTGKLIEGPLLVVALISFALLQLMVQLIFFLHVGRESHPRWNTMALLFAVMVVFIVVVGSLWIMDNLNYNMMMSPTEMNNHMMHEEGIYK